MEDGVDTMDRVWFVFAAHIDGQDLSAGHTSISVTYCCAFGVDGLVAIVGFFFVKQRPCGGDLRRLCTVPSVCIRLPCALR